MSKRLGTKADQWKRYRARHLPYVERTCDCGSTFNPKGFQKRCDACRTLACGVCRKSFISPNARPDQMFCSRRCAAMQPHVLERLKLKRGKKPRTYHLRSRERGNAFDREWRRLVFERDDYTCQKCGQHGGRLEADHIKPYSRFPRLRYVLSNGRTLCVPCHRKTPTYGSKARRVKPSAKRLSQEVLAFT